MSAVTLFERRMEKALTENITAMFSVLIGDSHQHARVKGYREGLEKALALFRETYKQEDSEDGV